jgi:hypothetical protein
MPKKQILLIGKIICILLKRNNMMYFIVGLVCFVIGFVVAAVSKDNINIGFGNQNITMIDGEIVDKSKKK